MGYIGIAISGLYQKTLGAQKDEDVTKILAVQSLFGIGAAIISTVVYGFLLTNIPIATSMLIAAIATTVVSALSVAAPFMSFTRASAPSRDLRPRRRSPSRPRTRCPRTATTTARTRSSRSIIERGPPGALQFCVKAWALPSRVMVIDRLPARPPL